jgi:hypothetical protein
MKYADLGPLPKLPQAVCSFDPDAVDACCINPVQRHVPPIAAIRRLRSTLASNAQSPVARSHAELSEEKV